MVIRFVADRMLGRLAKWLRILGYDTHYQPFYQGPVMDQYIKDGRLLLSRKRSTTENYTNSFLIKADTVKSQLNEMRNSNYIKSARSMWLTRCLVCNSLLQKASPETARDMVPEYVYNQNHKDIRFCGSCEHYLWPGSHRDRIINQLKMWGF